MTRRGYSVGYTAVELMMALAVLSVSVSGVIAMQKLTVASNRHARDVAIANRIAQAWLEQLRVDAQLWNYPSTTSPATTDLSDGAWLSLANGEDDFALPAWSASRHFGPGFDPLGRPIDHVELPSEVAFCTQIRLRSLTLATSTRGLLRATVRVFWRRYGSVSESTPAALCEGDGNPTDYHSIYHTTVIRQHATK